MALRTVKHSDPPCVARVFPISTVAVLHDTDAPTGCKHLPAGLIAHTNTGANLVWIDATGTTVTTVIPAGAAGHYLPISPAELTGANAVAVTVFWRK